MLAHKYYDDKPVRDRQWSKVGGIPMVEVKFLEWYLFEMLEFRLYVSRAEYLEVEK